MGASYKDSSAHQLRLRLYSRAENWRGPTVFANGAASRGGLAVEAWIIGSSHVLEVHARDFSLTELLACEPLSRGCPVALWAPGDPVVEYTGIPDARYRFEASVMDSNQSSAELPELRRLIDHAEGKPHELGLSYRFPGAGGQGSVAETLVWATAIDGAVVARTAHSYPSEALVVMSLSEIQLAATARANPEVAVLTAT